MDLAIDNAGFECVVTVPDAEVGKVHRPLIERFLEAAGDDRATVLVAGPPACGKTVLCEVWQALADQGDVPFVALSMDGYHYPNAYLEERGLMERKGSPETFDVRSMTISLAQIHAGTPTVWPRYDRNTHEPVADGVRVEQQKVVVVEGNYLLLDEPHWAALRRYCSLTVRIDVDRACLKGRLLERHMRGGRTREEAEQKFSENDLHNIVLVEEGSVQADIVLMRDQTGALRMLAGGGRGL